MLYSLTIIKLNTVTIGKTNTIIVIITNAKKNQRWRGETSKIRVESFKSNSYRKFPGLYFLRQCLFLFDNKFSLLVWNFLYSDAHASFCNPRCVFFRLVSSHLVKGCNIYNDILKAESHNFVCYCEIIIFDLFPKDIRVREKEKKGGVMFLILCHRKCIHHAHNI